MFTALDVYKKYRVNNGLQEHMLRVAAVADVICAHIRTEVDREHVVSACLLHDTGNIIKAKLENTPELFEPEGIEYWRPIQREFIEKYGNEHHASMEIAKEVGVSVLTQEYIDMIGAEGILPIAEKGSLENKICAYSDMRVGLHGVLSLAGRLDDLFERRKRAGRYDVERAEQWRRALEKFEEEVFANADIRPSDITDEMIASVIVKLKEHPLV